MFPELSGGSESSPVIMDFLLLTQVDMVVMVAMVDMLDMLVMVVMVDMLDMLVMVVMVDFLFLTQANHTIYDYGSFGFWGAVLAGGTTMLADGYRSTFPF